VGEDTLLSCSECEYTANEELAMDAHLHCKTKELPFDQTISYKLELKKPLTEMITRGKLVILQCKNTKKLLVACLSRGRTLNANKLSKQFDNTQALAEVFIEEIENVAQVNRIHFMFDNILAIECTDNTREDSSEHTLSLTQTVILNALEKSDSIRIVDIHNTRPGDPCYECHAAGRPKAALKAKRAIEVGHTFLLGDKYSKPLEATFQAANVSDQKYPIQMGCYGLGITRILAAVAEATHDKYGLRWPWSLAPYRVCIVPLQQVTN
jgi:prolyl-tRNA synthetase